MNNRKEKFLKNWKKNKILFIAIATIAILFFPIGFIHELGHVVVCVSNGYDYTLTIGDLALNTQCSSTPQPVWLYFSLGGIFGLIASLMLFLSRKIRNSHGIIIGVSVTAFDHLLKAIFETISHSAYLSNNPSLFIFMSILLVFLMIILLWFFHKRSNKITQPK